MATRSPRERAKKADTLESEQPRQGRDEEAVSEEGVTAPRIGENLTFRLAAQMPIEERFATLHRQLKPFATLKTVPGMYIDGQAKFVAHTLPEGLGELEILFLSDVQFGSMGCKVDKFKEYIQWILAKPNRYCFLGGDLIDAYRVGSPGTGYDNMWVPESQFFKFCEMVAPMRHRILGSVGGNHERRGLAGGVDFGSLIATALSIPYSAGGQAISIRYGKHQPLRAYLWHGRGAARTAGARVNMTLSAVPNDDAQVYFSGHIHWAHVYAGWHAKRDERHNCLRHEKYYVVSAASFLDFWGGYGEIAGMTYSGLLMPVLLVRPDGTFRVEM